MAQNDLTAHQTQSLTPKGQIILGTYKESTIEFELVFKTSRNRYD
jgi:hypothetical protein